jgi:outer membrane protein TolC
MKLPLLALALLLCASCGKYSFYNPEPYIGPVQPSLRTESSPSVPPPPEQPQATPTATTATGTTPVTGSLMPTLPPGLVGTTPSPIDTIATGTAPGVLTTTATAATGTAGIISTIPTPTDTLMGVEMLPPPQPIVPMTSSLAPVTVSISDAVFTSLKNNPSLVVSSYNPQISRTLEEQQKAAFDPDLTSTVSRGRTEFRGPGFGTGLATSVSDTTMAQVGYSQFFPAGTQVAVTAGTMMADDVLGGKNDLYATRLGVAVTQPMLRGFGSEVNLVAVRQARIDTLSSEYQLRGFAESLVAQVEETYWNYALAQRQIEIFNESLKLAQRQLNETNLRIRVGKLAPTERAAAEAEVAQRRTDLIVAQATLDQTRLTLLRLINPTQSDFWNRDISIKTEPLVTDFQPGNLEDHVRLALRMRPDLNEAKLLVQRGDLQVVKTKNGLLPRLDLFATLGKSGYADSLGQSGANMGQRGYDALVGVNFEYPPINRNAQAQFSQARLTRDQSSEAVTNLAQLVQSDVRGAYVSIVRTQEAVVATAVTRRLQEVKVRVESEKFSVGKSTSLLVAQAQRDLLASQIGEIQAVVSHLIAYVEFYRLEGTLLERRGISSPGRDPVTVADVKSK